MPVPSLVRPFRQFSTVLVLQNAAAANGTGTVANCDGFNGIQIVEIQVTGTPASSTTPVCQFYLEGSFDQTTWYQMGILPRDNQATPLRSAAPIYYINPTIAAPTLTPSASGGRLGAGTYFYAITDAAVGPTTESVIGTASASSGALTGSTNSIALSAIPTGPTGTAVRNIYRSSTGNTGPWQLIGTLSDNTTTTFTDFGTATPGANPPTTWAHVYYADDFYPNVRCRIAGVTGTLVATAKLYALPV